MFIAELFKSFSDVLFPPRADERTVRTLTDDTVNECYRPYHTDEWTALASFKDARIRALVHQAKFEGDRNAQKLLAILVERYCKECALNEETIWIPIPLSPARLRARGSNQVEAILSHTNVRCTNNVLIRTRDTKQQTTLTKTERLINMENAFEVVTPHSLTGKHILIIDDVVTTGATLRAAKDAFQKHTPRSITLLALAH